MSEAILIEIAQRFRKLEDLVEKADLFHAARSEHFVMVEDRAEDNYKRHKNYDRWCREANDAKKERDAIQDVREGLEKALELCREDMTNMQELIRKSL